MKSKTVCFFHPSPISTNFTGLHQSEWPLQAPHTINMTTTHKFKKLHALQRRLDAHTVLLAVRPSSPGLFWLKRSLLLSFKP